MSDDPDDSDPSEYDPDGVWPNCCECQEQSVGYDDGQPYCAFHYQQQRFIMSINTAMRSRG